MSRILSLIILIWAAAGVCPAAIYTVPQDCSPGGANSCVTEEGNSATNILFDNPSNTRVQAAFVAADLVAAGCIGSCSLDSIGFRLDQFQSLLGVINAGIVDIYLSAVASARSNANGLGLSNVYATNIDNASRVLVYSGPLTLSSANGGGSPNAFDLTISFQTSFNYSTSADLLFDIIWTSGYTRINRALDATTLETGVNSSAVGYVNAGPAGGANGSLSTNRLAAQFNVPEPGSVSLAFIAGLGLLAMRRARSRPLAQ